MARTGMTDLIRKVRQMGNAGSADFTIAGVSYWSDDQLQELLDDNRLDVVFEELTEIPEYDGSGNTVYYEYRSRFGNFESGTVFAVKDSLGAAVGTALWTADYQRGIVTFISDTGGDSAYLDGASYDIEGAAADLWEQKAAQYGESFDWSSDNHSIRRGQVVQNALKMAEIHRRRARIMPGVLTRSDEVAG